MDNTPVTPAPVAAPPAAPLDPQQAVASAWADQALWSEVANRMGQSIEFWRVATNALAITGLVLSVVVGSVAADKLGGPDGQAVLATLSVLLLAAAPYLRQKLLSPERVLGWTRARNVAEQLKEAIFRHLMGALPAVRLADGSLPADASGPGNLVRHCRVIKQATAELALPASTTVAPPRQRKTSMLLADYLSDRLDNQINYFRQAAARHGRSARRLQRAEFVLGLLTALVGALAGNLLPAEVKPALVEQAFKLAPLTPLLVLLGAVGLAVTNHLSASRALELASKHFGAHEQLKSLRDEWLVAPDRDAPDRVLRLVDEVELALAAEHGSWMSGWQLHQSSTPAAAPVAAVAGGVAAVALAPAAEQAAADAADAEGGGAAAEGADATAEGGGATAEGGGASTEGGEAPPEGDGTPAAGGDEPAPPASAGRPLD